MIRQVRSLSPLAAALVLSACASMGGMSSSPAPAKVADGVFTNGAGMTLYTFDKDAPNSGKSVCNGPCVALWPPLMAASDAQSTGDWTVVTRDDGSKQWAYKGKPLYLWSKDQKPGDRTGDGFNNAWRLAKP